MEVPLWIQTGGGLVLFWTPRCFTLEKRAAAPMFGAAQAKPSLFQSISDLNGMGCMCVSRWGTEEPTEAMWVSSKGPEPALPPFSLSPSSVLAKGGEDAHAGRSVARSPVQLPLSFPSQEKAISIWESKNFFIELDPIPGAVEAVKQMANLAE